MVDSRKSEDFSDRSQKNLRKVGQYDEAPLQIKNIMKRKSREEICKESEIVSLEISRKQFKEDLQLMEYMCSKKDLLTHSQENMKMSLGS